jgi:hypothetical protein
MGPSPGIDGIGHQRLLTDAVRFLAAIPIRVFIISDAGTNAIIITIPPSGENCSRSRSNRVHVPVESAFMMSVETVITMSRNMHLMKLPAAADRGALTATGVNGLALASAGAVVEAESSRDHESQRGDLETLGV